MKLILLTPFVFGGYEQLAIVFLSSTYALLPCLMFSFLPQHIPTIPQDQKNSSDDRKRKGKLYIEAVHNRCKQEHYHTIQKESSDIGYMIQYPPAFHSRNQLQQTGAAQKKKQHPSARMQLLSRNCQCIVVARIIR